MLDFNVILHSILCYAMVFYTILNYSYYTILCYNIALCSRILCYNILFYATHTVRCYPIFYAITYYMILYCTVLS